MNIRSEKKKWIDFCLGFNGVYEDYPFDDNWAVMRHTKNKKAFAFIYETENEVWINFKAEPMQSDFWRSVYKSVIPAYHMNKVHWNTIKIPGDVPDEDIRIMAEDSFNLTRPKK